MAKTFAQHLFALTDRDHSRSTRPATPVAATNAPAKKTPGVANTYAGVVLLMAMGSTSASAATDGLLAGSGASSSGSVNIGMTIPERLDVQGLADVELRSDGSGALSGHTSACVSGLGSGQYHLSAIGSGRAGAFAAVHGGRGEVPYEVTYSDNHQSSTSQPLTMGQALNQLTGSGSYGCANGANNARLSIRMASTPTTTADSALPLRGALTLLLSPE